MNLSWKLEKCENHVHQTHAQLVRKKREEKEEKELVCRTTLNQEKMVCEMRTAKNCSIVREKVIGLINAVI